MDYKEIIKFVDINSEMDLPRGYRNTVNIPLTDDEINFLKKEIYSIQADESVFIFNDAQHIQKSTCYNVEHDKIYVTKNIFSKNIKSSHPRDQLTPRAMLAHEYYGHRPERERYLKEDTGRIKRMPRWKDEVYASINAAFNTPNLSLKEREILLNDAGYSAFEAGYVFELTEEMKKVIYAK